MNRKHRRVGSDEGAEQSGSAPQEEPASSAAPSTPRVRNISSIVESFLCRLRLVKIVPACVQPLDYMDVS